MNPGRARLRQAVPGQRGFAKGPAEATCAWPLQGHDTTDPVDSASADRDLGLRWSPPERQVGGYDQTVGFGLVGALALWLRRRLSQPSKWSLAKTGSTCHQKGRHSGASATANGCCHGQSARQSEPRRAEPFRVHQPALRLCRFTKKPDRVLKSRRGFRRCRPRSTPGGDLGAASHPVSNELPGPHAGRGEPPRPTPLILQSAGSTGEHREVRHLYGGVSCRGPTPWEDWTAFRSPDSGDLGFPRSCSSRVLNSFETKRFLSCGGRVVSYHSVPPSAGESARKLPYSLEILLENLPWLENALRGTVGRIRAVPEWAPRTAPAQETANRPARVLIKDSINDTPGGCPRPNGGSLRREPTARTAAGQPGRGR